MCNVYIKQKGFKFYLEQQAQRVVLFVGARQLHHLFDVADRLGGVLAHQSHVVQ